MSDVSAQARRLAVRSMLCAGLLPWLVFCAAFALAETGVNAFSAIPIGLLGSWCVGLAGVARALYLKRQHGLPPLSASMTDLDRDNSALALFGFLAQLGLFWLVYEVSYWASAAHNAD
jgi:hypothetical protein